MLAWAFGMPVIFGGMDIAFEMTEIWKSVLVVGIALLVAGTIVGVIQGRFLVILAKDEGEKAAEPFGDTNEKTYERKIGW